MELLSRHAAIVPLGLVVVMALWWLPPPGSAPAQQLAAPPASTKASAPDPPPADEEPPRIPPSSEKPAAAQARSQRPAASSQARPGAPPPAAEAKLAEPAAAAVTSGAVSSGAASTVREASSQAEPPAPAQGRSAASRPLGTSMLAELRQIGAVREHGRMGARAALRQAARAYLDSFPQGRYRDEALLALADALTAAGEAEPALARYEELVEHYPQSPFREPALAGTLHLQTAAGQTEAARVTRMRLFRDYPNSTYGNQILLREGQARFARGELQGALDTFGQVAPAALSGPQQAELYRASVAAYLGLGDAARAEALLPRYLATDDPPERKAALLLSLGAQARQAGRNEAAHGHYARVVRDYPSGEALDEALYWRAVLHGRLAAGLVDSTAAATRRQEAIAQLDSYLARDDAWHRAPALAQRADLHAAQGRSGEALADYDRLDALRPPAEQSPDVLRRRVALLKSLRRGDEALPLLAAGAANATLSQAERAVFRLELADQQYRAGLCAEVVPALTPMPVFADRDGQLRASFLRGVCLHRTGQHDRAALDLEALLQEPDYLELVWPTLLDAYEADGQHSRVVTLGQDLVLTGRLQPTVGLTRRILNGYARLGEPGMGLSLLRRLEETRREAMSAPEMRVLLGQAEAAHGDKARALTRLQAALAEAERQPLPAAPDYYFQAHATLQALLAEQGQHAAAAAQAFRAAERANTPEQQALAAGWLGTAYAGWGHRAASRQQPSAAMQRLMVALAFLPQAPPAPRAAAVDALARLLARDNPTLATQRYQQELILAEDSAYRERLRAGLGALYLEWAERAKQSGNVAQAIAQYRNALHDLPSDNWRERYALSVQLDTLYQAQGDHSHRVALYDEFAGEAVPADLRTRLRQYQSQLYREWGDAEAAAGRPDKALQRYHSGLARLTPREQQWRFDLVAAMGRLHERQGRQTDAVLLYERELPRLGDGPLARRLREELGRLYVAWGQAAEKQNNSRSARIRYYYALDHLPPEAWRSRLAAVVPLAQLLEREDDADEAAQLFASLVPTITDDPTRQRYALYLGRVYQEQLKQTDEARRWLEQAAGGPTRIYAIEAGYLLAELDLAQAAPLAARERLAALASSGLTDTQWAVPIHYRLAVLLHEDKQLEQALRHYRIVAGVSDDTLRKLYARPIAQARQQAEAIESYLRLQGGRSDVSVPKVKSAR